MFQPAFTQFSLLEVQRLKQNKENNKGCGVWRGSVQLYVSEGVFVSYFGILTFALCLDLHPPGIMHECQDLWMSSTTVTIFIKLDSILIFWVLLDAQKAPNPMNSVLLGIHDLNNNLGSTIMVIHSCVAKSQNPPKIHHSDVWSVERAHDLHNMSGISEEAVPVDWAHCEERSLGSFAAKSDFKFGQICSFAHLPPIKMQSVWNYPFWLCFAVLVTASIILENLNFTLFLPFSDLQAFVDLQQYNHQRHNLHGKSVRRERICEQ